MATRKITEVETAESVTSAASILVTQFAKDASGATVESLRRATLEALSTALQNAGINEDVLQKAKTNAEDLEALSDRVETVEKTIGVVYLPDTDGTVHKGTIEMVDTVATFVYEE